MSRKQAKRARFAARQRFIRAIRAGRIINGQSPFDLFVNVVLARLARACDL